jgi:hypothetical protein
MDTVTLKNGAALPVIRVTRGTQTIQNAQRSTLIMYFEASGSFDTLLSQLADTSEITITSETTLGDGTTATEQNLYSDYTVIFKRAVETELTSAETADAPAVYRQLYVYGVAQKLYSEKLLEQLLAAQ